MFWPSHKPGDLVTHCTSENEHGWFDGQDNKPHKQCHHSSNPVPNLPLQLLWMDLLVWQWADQPPVSMSQTWTTFFLDHRSGSQAEKDNLWRLWYKRRKTLRVTIILFILLCYLTNFISETNSRNLQISILRSCLKKNNVLFDLRETHLICTQNYNLINKRVK